MSARVEGCRVGAEGAPPLGGRQAMLVVDAVVGLARADGGSGVAAAVVDGCGHLVAFLRSDGAPLRASRIAIMKAYTASRFHCATAQLSERLARSGRPLAEYGDRRFTALAGGVPITAPTGGILGAVGVSGRTPEADHDLALAALARVGDRRRDDDL